jgi:GTP pyrophosphokinase
MFYLEVFLITSSELISLIQSYEPEADVELLKKAYMFSVKAHKTQRRLCGASFFQHPAEVAKILAELKLDVMTVATGLLHDVLEDTDVSHDELKEVFGTKIAFLVDGVTKLSQLSDSPFKVQKAESYRKFLLAISKDIRVLVVKLADRLHNIRTLNYIDSIDKRKRIALETLEIYVPLAERIGISIIKDEMENLAFYNLHPDEYVAISTRIRQISSTNSFFIQNNITELKSVFNEAKMNVEISGREKKEYSIWKKMQRRNVALEQINDIIAFRIIVKSTKECYEALGVIHTKFQIVPGRFKDYISIPKLNNYRALHTTVIGPLNQRVEVQIKTKEMHHVADEGIAAHWAYKSGDVATKMDFSQNYSWLRNLITTLQNSKSSEELMTNYKLEMFENEVFCFTPAGDLITLPSGATAVDFAYEIHTTIGNTCIGVRINGKMVPLKTILRNGDQVDIITSPYQCPEAAWERFVVTGKAKSCIKRFVRLREKSAFTKLGEQLTRYMFSKMKVNFSEDLVDLQRFSCDSIDTFYYNVSKKIISFSDISLMIQDKNLNASPTAVSEEAICMSDFSLGIAFHFPSCCHPIFGDKIVAVLMPPHGLFVHMANCSKVESESDNLFVKIKWNREDETEAAFIAKLQIVIVNKRESLQITTNIISSNGASVINMKVEHRSLNFFDLVADIKVTDTIHLGEVLAALRTCSNVKFVRVMARYMP